MVIPFQYFFLFISTLACLDSALKVNMGGFYLQLGVLIGLIFFSLLLVTPKYKFNSGVLSNDPSITLFLLLLFSHGFLAMSYPVYLQLISYSIVFILLYISLAEGSSQFNYQDVAFYCLVILLITGFLQYILINVFSYQLELRGVSSDYYAGNGDLAYRMRGFFLEPNWYGLILFSWVYVYIRSQKTFSIRVVLFLALCMVALFLSGNRLILLFLVLLSVSFYFRKVLEFFSSYVVFLIVSISVGLFLYLTLTGDFSADRSAIARFYTAVNVYDVMSNSSVSEILYGYGFSNWGYYSNLMEFSWSNYMFDQELTRRDNSELYVVFFEMGFVGLLFLAFDCLLLSNKNADSLDKVFLACFYIAAIFYPIYTFMFYLIPVMLVRARVIKGERWS
jgi:hypothetical protein